jgi:hypothetical protein
LISALANSRRRGLVVLGLFVASLAVGALALPSLHDMSDHGVGIVRFELTRTAAKAAHYYGELGDSGRDAARTSLYLDFPYLVLYGLFFFAACTVVAARAAERGMASLGRMGQVLAVAGLVAAGCDAIENLALLRILAGHTDQPWPGIAFGFASAKFALSFAAALYVIVGFLLTLRTSARRTATL